MPLLPAVVLAALLAVASAYAVRDAWRSADVLPQLRAASLLGATAAAVAVAVTEHLAPVPSCGILQAYDEAAPPEDFGPCGGGWGLLDRLTIAAPFSAATALLAGYYLLVARAWHAGRRRQEGWSACATS